MRPTEAARHSDIFAIRHSRKQIRLVARVGFARVVEYTRARTYGLITFLT